MAAKLAERPRGVEGVADAAHPDNIIFDIQNAEGTGGTG
jgi:hypothetical protein